MGAYNWILVDAECPSCASFSRIRCQTHVASDYGGIGGRFFDREYSLGQEMVWWPRDHARWDEPRRGLARGLLGLTAPT
jgi:hypothetical protein